MGKLILEGEVLFEEVGNLIAAEAINLLMQEFQKIHPDKGIGFLVDCSTEEEEKYREIPIGQVKENDIPFFSNYTRIFYKREGDSHRYLLANLDTAGHFINSQDETGGGAYRISIFDPNLHDKMRRALIKGLVPRLLHSSVNLPVTYVWNAV